MPGPAEPPVRCFIGVPLPDHVRRELAALTGRCAGTLASRMTWTRPENAHITLKFLGDVPAADVDALRQSLRAVVFAPFDLLLGGAGCFPACRLGQAMDKGRGGAPKVLWAGVAHGAAELAVLAGAVESACAGRWGAPGAEDFTPHLTIGRVRVPAQGDPWREALRLMGEAAWQGVRVERFVLWRSILGLSGPKHAPLEDCSALAAATPGAASCSRPG